MSRLPRKTVYLHLSGVGLCVLSIILNGPISHDTGVAIAIGTVTLLGIRSLPTVEQRDKLNLIIGSVIDGGMRQGQFIKSCFTIALLTSGLIQQFLNSNSGVPTLLLGAALGISAVANEFEIRTLKQQFSTLNSHTSSERETTSESSHN